mmetsp:Transcript_11463/g.30096  ORF Transcript_11463/g.30096 Transcript_11463/m.30096 type:complete len:656 (-) Transcript_11463:37-2004(-)
MRRCIHSNLLTPLGRTVVGAQALRQPVPEIGPQHRWAVTCSPPLHAPADPGPAVEAAADRLPPLDPSKAGGRGAAASSAQLAKVKPGGDDEPGAFVLWPFLNATDEGVGRATLGEAFPFAVRLDDETSADRVAAVAGQRGVDAQLDLAVLASALPWLGEERGRALLLERWAASGGNLISSKCSAGVLAALVRGFGTLLDDARCDALLGKAVAELLSKKSAQVRHITPMLALLGKSYSNGKAIVPMWAVLRLSRDVLSASKETDMVLEELVAAFEGLVRARETIAEHDLDMMIGEVAVGLARFLRGGHGLKCHLLHARTLQERGLAIRALATLWGLPEVAGCGRIPAALASLPGIRWPGGLPPHLDEATVAAAGCALARSGAWAAGRGGFLLAQALHRQNLEPEAAALWLCAVGQSGLALDKATDKPGKALAGTAEELLVGGVEALVNSPGAGGKRRSLVLARALWGLCALKKTDKRDELLACLADIDAARYPDEVWALLLEVRQAMSTEESHVEAFAAEAWQQGLQDAAAAQAVALSASGRLEELQAVVQALGTAVAPEGDGEDVQVGDLELVPVLGPYSAALRLGGPGLVLDLDAHESPVNRALRRQQWATLAPEVRVAEIPLSTWDALDRTARVALVRRRILGIEDPIEDDNE